MNNTNNKINNNNKNIFMKISEKELKSLSRINVNFETILIGEASTLFTVPYTNIKNYINMYAS